MNFKKGETIEVFSKRGGPTFSWWTAKIVSSHGPTHIVNYNHKLDEDLAVNLEQVSAQAVRPYPPFVYEPTWVAGDIVEVFDDHSWKPAEILNVVRKRYIIRFLGLDKVRKVRSYDVRIRLSWENEEWVVIKQQLGKTKLCVPMDRVADCESAVLDKTIPSSKRRRTQICADVCDKIISSQDEVVADEFLNNSTTVIKNDQYVNANSEPNDRESVGSCDINDSCVADDEISSRLTDVTSYVLSDSSCCIGEMSSEEIHRLELHAYRETLMSLYESGPISWDQEAFITDLRFMLHISNDEHFVLVKKLMSAAKSVSLRGTLGGYKALLLQLSATAFTI